MNATDTTTPADPTPVATFAFLSDPEKSLLASRRPDVVRMRVVYQFNGDAILYIGYPEDTGAPSNERMADLVRSFAKLVADAAAKDLGEPSHYRDAVAIPVRVQIFAQKEIEGPSAEIFIDESKPKPWDMEVVFDGGMNTSRDAAHWIVDVLVSAADQLKQGPWALMA